MNNQINTIGVLTSGGDAPGMNAAIRAVVRAGNFYQKKVIGIYEGLQGLIDNNMAALSSRSVKGILNRGGTILKSSRSEEFRTMEGRQKAYGNLKKNGIDALLVIGGDGTFTGSKIFSEEFDFPIIGLPGTIDNDLFGSDFTIGFDTATNVVVQCVDKIRDTAESHNRLFFVEVMGRDSGFIALRSALASGALDVVLPEESAPMEDLFAELEKSVHNKKTHKLVIVAEGNKWGNAFFIAEQVRKKYPELESKVTILGHLQRGGDPSCTDRVLASRLGVAAVEGLLKGKRNVMAGLIDNKVKFTSFSEAISRKAILNDELLRISKILAI